MILRKLTKIGLNWSSQLWSLCYSQRNQLSEHQTGFKEQMKNVTEFLLFGLTQNADVQKLLFALFTLLYFLTVAGNLLIIVTVTTSRALGSPMYLFLSFSSFIDHCCSSTMAPQMIFDLRAQKKPSPSVGIWLSSLQSISSEELRSSCSRWWPMTALWLSASPCIRHHNEQASVWPPGGHGLGWRISSCSDSNSFYSLVALLWPQHHWPFHLWPFPSAEILLHGHSHLWSFCCCQQWADVYAHLFHCYHLLRAHPLLSKNTRQHCRTAESALHLRLPCYCSDPVLCTLYICVPSAHDHLPYW